MTRHQFAFPVKWIDTQDVILNQMGCERTVEVGPSSTLTIMAKRTVAAKFKDTDEAMWFCRELLLTEQDYSAIAFENAESVKQPYPLATSKNLTPADFNTAPKIGSVLPVPDRVNLHKTYGKKHADVKATAKAILITLVAHKVKKPTHGIRDQDSIKVLALGAVQRWRTS